ncbi:unnamed protein product, partial [Rotaria sp. Silwood1]
LTWHYNCELLPDREVKCFCGSKNCRGRILFPSALLNFTYFFHSINQTNESFFLFYLKLATSSVQKQQQNATKLNTKNTVLSSLAMPINTSLSSSQSTDESIFSTIHLSNISKTKKNLLSRMISLKNSSNNKTTIGRSYNLRSFEITHDHYSIVIHFLDDSERTFFIDVS